MSRIRRLVVLVLLTVVPMGARAQIATNLAGGEIFVAGSVTGAYANTHASDDVYESIQEVQTPARPFYSYLEHKWSFYITGGTSVTFLVEAWRPSNSDGDDFVFSYSVDGATFTDLVTVTKNSDDDAAQSVALPSTLRGTVFVRVRDTNRKNGKTSRDTIYVDRLAFVCQGTPAIPDGNLLTNPGFEEGLEYWWTYWTARLSNTTAHAHSGLRSCYVFDRGDYWEGPVHDLYNIMANGLSYTNSAWVRMANAATGYVWMTVKQVSDGRTNYSHMGQGTIATSNAWTQISGVFTLQYTSSLSELHLYIEGPPSGTTFYVDDVVVVGSGAWREEADARIEAARKRDVHVAFLDALGRPLTNASVEVRQLKHDFGFGSAMSAWVRYNANYASFFTNHFEWAVFENETKWTQNEAEPTNYFYEHSDAMRDFCVSNGIQMRGHCIFWEVQDFVQDWVQELTNAPADLRAAVSNRLHSVVPRYDDDFRHWDVNNEMMHGNFFSNCLGNEIRTWMFQRAKELDPDAKLFVNDYGVVSYSDTDTYVDQVRGLLSNGAPVEAIGAQCHMWELNPYLVLSRLNKLAEVGLPIWCTEFDVAHPDETERARLLETFYRAAFSHPAVEGILMWGFWASNHWRGADAALVNGDWTTNAAGRKYEELMREWTTVTNVLTDTNGVLSFRGFHGTYRLTVTAPGVTQIVENVGVHAGEDAVQGLWIVPGRDSDGDGMPDAWETEYDLNPAVDDAGADGDEDGVRNGDEYTAFTDPGDETSQLDLDMALAPDGTHVVLSFSGAPHRRYSIGYRSAIDAGGWAPVVADVPGNGGVVSLTNACPGDRGHYRLGARLP